MKTIILKVEGMTCSACSNHVEKYLNKQKGVIDATVNLVMGQAIIHYEDNLSVEMLGNYINASGYKYGGIYNEKEENKKNNNWLYIIILSILMIFIMYITMGHMLKLPEIAFLNKNEYPINYALILCIFSIPYLIYGRDIILAGIKNLIHKSLNMDTLISLGVLVSFIYSFINMILIIMGNYELVDSLYFESAGMIILFIKLGRVLDNNSKEKTKEAIKELALVTPEKALLKLNEKEQEVTIDMVKVGDILIVKPGMKVAVDGEIVKGQAHFDETFITGEANPVKKQVGDQVMAGAINYDGIVEYKALNIGPKSTISQMVHLVMEASNSKMPIARSADKVSSYFVPIILGLAFLTFIIYMILGFPLNVSLTRMVTVLLVACPCSLGLATPLASIVAIGFLAKNNILVKSSESLEMATKINTIVFDKTGTLTYGKLKVSKVYNYSNYSDQELLNIVANIESNSTHPIAKAFTNYKLADLKVDNYEELTGLGVTAAIEDKKYYLGNEKILKKIVNNYKVFEKILTSKGNSVVYLVEDNKIIGLIGVKDVIRKEAKKTIKELKELDYQVVMLTGDNEVTAKIIGKELGITNIIAGVMPSDKTNYIKKLQEEGRQVLMVGDGINDAPSLASADIGVSFKSSTDIAANSSNVIITNDNVYSLLTFLNMGKRTLKNIKENLFWAFFYNALMVPIAMGVFQKIGLVINPMIASAVMMLSSLCVVFNALRLRKDRGTHKKIRS